MWNTWRRIRYQISPTIIIWISILVFLICGSVFGIVTTRGSGASSNSHGIALQVTPDNVSVGATVIVNGEHFNPHGKIGLTRDASIPIQDTANATIIEADSKGNFTDTLVITPDWGTGFHTVNTEDASMHKVASFSIMVTGHAGSLRPAHLSVSVDTLALGSGAQTTNTTKTITLTNIGGGLISWQANSSQSWLLLSPPRGTFASDRSASLMVAIDRSKLNPGSYSAQINIFSTAGNSTIPVTAAVTALVPEHNTLLQTDPALLSFTAIDGGSPPSTQTITISNPGLHPLQWQATTNTNWLFVSPQSATIDPSGSLTVTVSVNSSLLLPGTYNAAITFVNSTQTIFVTLTIMPQCSPLVTPGQLNFASIYQQGKPPAKAISIEIPQSCNTPESWKAISNANWLTLNTTSGQTPAFPTVGIDVSGLSPGVYHSSITLSSVAWTQTLPVTFTLGQAPIPLVTTAPDAISFNGTTGQFAPVIQQISITNSGNTGSLHWHAIAAGGDWLAVSPTAGTLMTHHSVSFNIKASVLPTLVSGIYNGTVTIVGTDSFGHPALGSPQVIPVSLLVKPACTFTVASGSLNFTGISGQAAPINQQIALQISPSCTHKLNWTVTNGGSNWLSASVVGTSLNVSASLTNLKANNYSGSVTVTAYDSVTKQLVGIPQVVPVALTAQPACKLQNPSTTVETFDTKAGNNPASQTFTVSVTGTCPGAVTIAPSIIFTLETGWVSVVADMTTIASGESTTFIVTVNSAHLPTGQYEAKIQLSASNNGITMLNTLQGIAVKLNVEPLSEPFLGTPTPTSSPTPVSVPIATPTPAPTPTPSPTPVSTPVPTATTTT